MTTSANVIFEVWYREHHPRLLATMTVAARDVHEAREVTDEAFARALARWSRVSEMASPAGWTYAVAMNVLKRRGRRHRQEHVLLQSLAVRRDLGDDHLIETLDLLAALPERQRTVLALRYIADLPEAEIARILGIRRGTVSSTITQARARLRQMTADDPPSPTRSIQGIEPSGGDPYVRPR